MTINDELFISVLKKNKPSLTNSSIKTYLSVFRTIAKSIGEDLMSVDDFVKYQGKIMDYMNSLTYSMKKSRIAGILSLLGKKDENSKEVKDAILFYTEKMIDAVNEYKKTEDDQELNERQKENFVSWDQIGEIWKKMNLLVEKLWRLNLSFKSADVKDIILHFVVLSLYYLIPPRRSRDMVLLKIRNFDTSEKSKDNYYTKLDNKWVFVFNDYKNASRLGRQVIVVPMNLRRIIDKWIKINESDYMIPGKNNKVAQPNKLNFMLKAIFNKDVGTSLLRHSFMSHHYGKINLDKLENVTHQMGNSGIKTMLRYVSLEHAEKDEK
jgi:hypothetical protein